MIKKAAPTKTGKVRVTFELPAEVAENEVAVAGEFNAWEPMATPLSRLKKGTWKGTVTLDAGASYAFRYVADGSRWFNDEAADDYVPNMIDGDNSVVNL